MSRTAVVLLAVLAVAVGIVAAMLLLQRSVLFARPAFAGTPAAWPRGAERVALVQGSALFLPATRPTTAPSPLFLFTHGNAELAQHWLEAFDVPRAQGWAVLLVEYPGYGGTPGAPSEASIVATELAAWEWAQREPRIDNTRIVAYGRSLGGGPATQLATQRPIVALVLESAFTSVRPLAARMFVPGFLVRDPFDNLAALAHYRGPMLVLHGTADEVIPVSHGRALAAAVPGAEFVPLSCGHNDCERQWPQVLAWLALNGVAPQ